MKKISYTFLFIFYANILFGESGIIIDPEGYTNVRNGKGMKFPIIAKLFNNDTIYYEKDCNSDWWQIYFGKKNETGFVHKSRIKILPWANFQTHKFKFDKNNTHIVLSIKEEEFNCKGHQITLIEDTIVHSSAILVDGKDAIGTDYSLPHSQISSMELIWDNRNIKIDKELYQDCYNPFCGVNDNTDYFISVDSDKFVFILHGSDGAGSYEMMWIFDKNGRHTRVYLGYFETPFLDPEFLKYYNE